MAETIWDAFYEDIVLKSKDWGYEQECRLIQNGLLEDSLDENKQKIIEVVQRKCQEDNRKDFKFFQPTVPPHTRTTANLRFLYRLQR